MKKILSFFSLAVALANFSRKRTFMLTVSTLHFLSVGRQQTKVVLPQHPYGLKLTTQRHSQILCLEVVTPQLFLPDKVEVIIHLL